MKVASHVQVSHAALGTVDEVHHSCHSDDSPGEEEFRVGDEYPGYIASDALAGRRD